MKPRAEGLLVAHVSTVVPMMICDLIRQGGITDAHIRHARHYADIIASHGDAIQYREKKNTANAIDALCKGLAIMALACPGGVAFMGMRFDENSGRALEQLFANLRFMDIPESLEEAQIDFVRTLEAKIAAEGKA